jgi:hypothetical protein
MRDPARPRKIVGRSESFSIDSKIWAHRPSARAWKEASR